MLRVTGSHPAPLNTKNCHGYFNWIHPRTNAVMPNMCKRNICKVLKMNRLKTLNGSVKTIQLQ